MAVGRTRQLVYVSMANDVDRPGLDRILDQSQCNNEHRGITGFLLFNGRNFLQLIEGEAESLNALMRRLAVDPRHSGIAKLTDKDVPGRCCAEWLMRELVLANAIATRREALEEQLPLALDVETRGIVLNFTRLN